MYIVESGLVLLVHNRLVVSVVKAQDVRLPPIVEGCIVGSSVSLHVLEEDVCMVVQQELYTVQAAQRTALHESSESIIVLQLIL